MAKRSSSGKEGGTPTGISRGTEIQDKVWSEDWTSPLNANNPKDAWPENDYPKPSSISPRNPMGFTALEEAGVGKKRK
jgi:hypothetical protein